MSGPGGFWKLLSIAALLLGTALAPAGAAAAAALTVLHNFYTISGSGDGYYPSGPLAFDKFGALYGTTFNGGVTGGGGTVFKLTPPADPSAPWTERILWSFTGPEGRVPLTGVIFDKEGNLYGTASWGGSSFTGCAHVGARPVGCGTVFEGIPPADPDGPWGGRLIWSFTGTPDGGNPYGLFLDDATGVIYGTTSLGGLYSVNCSNNPFSHYCGTVFALTPPASADAAWTFTVIYRFTGGADGGNPTRGLVRDASGALYGTTGNVVAFGQGTVFQLTPGPSGYTLKTIWSFTGGADGAFPFGSLTFNSGRLFGATGGGGAFGFGTVFEGFPPPTPGGDWGGAVYSFTGGADGNYPNGSLVFDNAGNLYGTSTGGACYIGHRCGTAFKGIPPATPNDAWGGVLLWTFSATGAGGYFPGPVILDAAGTALYGTANEGGAAGYGTAFKLTP